MKGTSRAKILLELGLESMSSRRNFHKLCLRFKIIPHLCPDYLYSLLPSYVCNRTKYFIRNSNNISLPRCNTDRYLKSFLPSTIHLWNNLPESIKGTSSLNAFKNEFTRVYQSKPPKWLILSPRFPQILLTRMRLGFCALNHYLYKRNLIDNPGCVCGSPNEDLVHFFLHCPIHATHRSQFLTAVNDMNIEFVNHLSDQKLVEFLISGSTQLNVHDNNLVLNHTMKFIISTNRFKPCQY